MDEHAPSKEFFVEGKLSTDFLEIVKGAVIKTFFSICQSEPQCIGIGQKINSDDTVIGIMSMVSRELLLNFALGLPRDTANHVILKFANKDIPFDSPDMGDAIAEISNIIAGDIAARLEAFGISATLSIPTVTRGKEMVLFLPATYLSANLLFSVAFGQFWVKAALGKPSVM